MRFVAKAVAVLGLVLGLMISSTRADDATSVGLASGFVTQLYEQFLGRAGAPDEIAAWANALASGALTADQVRVAIAESPEARARSRAMPAVCPPTPGVAPGNDIAPGRCLFHSTQAFGQEAFGPFASCARCHYSDDKSDHGLHLVQLTNRAGATIHVLRKTSCAKLRAC